MRDNPAQAVAIASGLLPSGVPNMPSGKAKGMLVLQYFSLLLPIY